MIQKRSFLQKAVGMSFLIGVLCGSVAVGTAIATLRGSAIFSDVPAGSFYDAAVGEMNAAGIIQGYDAKHFGPNDFVTRGQIAVLLKRLRDSINGVVPSTSSSSVSSVSSVSSSSVSSSSSSSSVAQAANIVNGSFHFTAAAFSYPDLTPSLSIGVMRSGGTQGTVTVKYTVSGGTAVAGVDFSANTATLTFAPGQTTQNFTVQLTKNTAATGGRTINLVLSNPSGGATLIDPSTAVITLTHNGISASSSSASSVVSGSGGAIAFSAVGLGVMENGGTATIKVVRSGSTTNAATVAFATSDGTGVNGSDYTRTSGTLSFAAGETQKSFTVSILDNTTVNGNRTVLLTLSNPTGGVVFGTPSTSTLTIVDDEMGPDGSGSIVFSALNFSANNHDGMAYATVTRGGGVTGTATVQYATYDDSALAGTDYTATSGTLTFNPGEMQKQIAIPLIRHTTAQGQISFLVRISNVTGNATLGSQTQAQVTTQG